jgi:hypothetical protein
VTNLNPEQKAALEAFQRWAIERKVAQQQWEIEAARLKTEYFARLEAQTYTVVTDAVNTGVPKRQLMLAYGTTHKPTIAALIEKYAIAPSAVSPTAPVATRQVTLYRPPYGPVQLTVVGWPAERTPGLVLDFGDVPIKSNGRIAGHVSDELLPLNHELVNSTELRSEVLRQIGEIDD